MKKAHFIPLTFRIIYHCVHCLIHFDSRSGSIVTDFNIVSESSQKVDAQTDIAKKILQLLSQSTNVTYNGAQYPVDTFSVKDSGGQNTRK